MNLESNPPAKCSDLCLNVLWVEEGNEKMFFCKLSHALKYVVLIHCARGGRGVVPNTTRKPKKKSKEEKEEKPKKKKKRIYYIESDVDSESEENEG